MTIRRCEERDLAFFEAFGSPEHVRYCHAEFARGDVLTILVAVDSEGVPVGKVHLDFEAKADEGAALLVAAAVAPPLQERGIGTELMRAAEEFVCSQGLGAIVLGVEDANPRARDLYERLGYQPIGAADFVYVGSPVPNPGVWMRKELQC